MKSEWWYVSPNFTNNVSPLVPTTMASGTDDERFFKDAQKLRITMEGAWIRDDKDGWGKGSNDLVIASKFRVGKNRPVTKLHYYKPDQPERQWESIVFHPEIFATNDFRESAGEIALQLYIYDEDGLSDSVQKELTQAMDSAASSAAIAFPVFAPYAGLAAGAGTALIGLFDSLDDHDEIMGGKIRLAVNRPADQAFDHLQPGFFVCFGSSVDASLLQLGSDKKVYFKDGGTHKEYEHVSYAVLRVDREQSISPDFEISQKMATLLTEIEQGKGGKGSSALHYLRSTIESYSTFKRLERHLELKNKAVKTDEEKQLLTELESDSKLIPFIIGGS